eukprot:scaffold79061_cov30-Tisochrysis_lutea.AAC.3
MAPAGEPYFERGPRGELALLLPLLRLSPTFHSARLLQFKFKRDSVMPLNPRYGDRRNPHSHTSLIYLGASACSRASIAHCTVPSRTIKTPKRNALLM